MATVLIGTPTVITRQPQGLTVDEGKPFTLSVAATGSTLSYQWSKSGTDIPGATSAEYTVSAAAKSNDGQYTCAVTGGCGTITSTPATVVVMGGTSVDEESDASAMLRVLGPVPADGDLTVRLNLDEMPRQGAHFAFIDMRGARLAMQGAENIGRSGDIRLKTDMLAPGMYTLEFTDGATIARTRVVIAR